MISFLHCSIANFNVPTWEKFADRQEMQNRNSVLIFCLIQYLYIMFIIIRLIGKSVLNNNKLIVIVFPLILIYILTSIFLNRNSIKLQKIYQNTSKAKKNFFSIIWLMIFSSILIGIENVRNIP
jgi:hypothetical protein